MDISNAEFLVPSTSVREIVNEDGAALLDVDQGICVSINPVGVKVWSLLKQRISPTQIAAQLVSEYSIDMVQAASDVTEFIDSLQRSQLLLPARRTPSSGRLGRWVSIAHRWKTTRNLRSQPPTTRGR